MGVPDLISPPASSSREANSSLWKWKTKAQLPRAPLGRSEEKRKAKNEGGDEGNFFYLPKSTLTGFTGLESRFSLLSCRVLSWDSLLLVSSIKIPNQMRRVPPFFSPIQNGFKNEEYRVFKRDLKLS